MRRLYKQIPIMLIAVIIVLSIFLGGDSGYDIAIKPILYIASIIALAWGLTRQTRSLKALLNLPFICGIVLLSLFIIYLIPLPPALTSGMGFRDGVANGYELANISQPFLPLTLTPETTYISLYDFLPCLAIAVLVLLVPKEEDIRFAFKGLTFAIVASALIAILQVVLTDEAVYFYDGGTRGGMPVGFFANTNHFATLMVCAIFIVFNHHRTLSFDRSRNRLNSLSTIGPGLLVFFLLSLTRCSSAVIILIALATAYWVIFANTVKGKWIALAICGGIFGLVALDYLLLGSNFKDILTQVTENKELSRLDIWSTVINSSNFPSFFGTGPGSYYETYLLMSQSSDFTSIYSNEAHNDFLQIIMEFGIFGAILMMVFLSWFVKQWFETLRGSSVNRGNKLMLLFIMTVPILHSITDYPLRTPAIMAIFVFSTVLLVRYNQLER